MRPRVLALTRKPAGDRVPAIRFPAFVRCRPAASLLLAGLAVLAVWLAAVASWQPFRVEESFAPDAWTRVNGIVHVHTTHSDGGGTPEEVIAAARAAGLGFGVITDHNNLDAKPVEGYRDGVLVVVGTEISPLEYASP